LEGCAAEQQDVARPQPRQRPVERLGQAKKSP